MIVKLVKRSNELEIEGHKEIYDNIDSIDTFTDVGNVDFINLCRNKEIMQTIRLNYIPSAEEAKKLDISQDSRPSLYSGIYLMNDKGQTIERLR